MMHTAKRRACALRLSPIGITSFCKEVANRFLYHSALSPCGDRAILSFFVGFVNFHISLTQKAALSSLTKGREDDKIKPVRTAAIGVAVVPKEILSL